MKKRWRMIAVSAILGAAIALGVTLLFPLEYRADAQVFIISKSRYGVDPYTIVRSAERVGENIAEVMKTNDFYEKVMVQPGYTIDKTRFEGEGIPERVKRKRWQKAVQPSVVFGTGVLNISAYSTNPDQAKALSGAAADALVTKGWEYVGGDVTIKVVNAPVVTRFPVRPSMVLNTVLGAVVGGLLMTLIALRKDR